MKSNFNPDWTTMPYSEFKPWPSSMIGDYHDHYTEWTAIQQSFAQKQIPCKQENFLIWSLKLKKHRFSSLKMRVCVAINMHVAMVCVAINKHKKSYRVWQVKHKLKK